MSQDDAPPAAVVDARGHRCPTPTLRLRRALEPLAPGARVRLLADDPMASIDVPHFAASNRHTLVQAKTDGPWLEFVIEKAGLA
jgi:tRNA 2-thiouridine synthesizing protein A